MKAEPELPASSCEEPNSLTPFPKKEGGTEPNTTGVKQSAVVLSPSPLRGGVGEGFFEEPSLPSNRWGGGVGSRVKYLHFLVFALVFGLWTWKLLEPTPIPESLGGRLGDWKFYAAKLLHAGAYAFLTVLATTLPLPRYWRWYFVGLLALHGIATEIGQTFVPNRTGSVRDVVIDWVGIGLGLLTWLAVSGGRRAKGVGE